MPFTVFLLPFRRSFYCLSPSSYRPPIAFQAEDEENVGFGKDGGAILSRGISAVLPEGGGGLRYELFSILVHSGGAIGGHYYAYIKDFAKNKWFEFNDSTISELADEDIRKTFGGGSTSAYMLMYRRIDPELNINDVGDTHLPTGLNEALQVLLYAPLRISLMHAYAFLFFLFHCLSTSFSTVFPGHFTAFPLPFH